MTSNHWLSLTSNHWLWLVLFLASIPLVLEATSGCSLLVGEDEEDVNAYSCACSCDVGSDPQSRPIAVGPGDVEEVAATGAMELDGSNLGLRPDQLVGLRFSPVIRQGVQIETAVVRFEAAQDNAVDTQITIFVEDSAAADPFSATDGNLSGRAEAPAPVVWTLAGDPWLTGEVRETPDLSALIQQVVDQADWDSQSALVLKLVTDFGERNVRSFEAGTAPSLEITTTSTIEAVIPVCEPLAGTASKDKNEDDPDSDPMQIDCAGRVVNTFKEFVSVNGCGDVVDTSSCTCSHTKTLSDDGDRNAFEHAVCNESCEPVQLDDVQCTNFDQAEWDACLTRSLEACERNGTPIGDCILEQGCLANIGANQSDPALGPVCLAAEEEVPSMATPLLARRSICEVSGTSEIVVGDDQREPKKNPRTLGRLEILGGPCPGSTCPVSFSSYLEMEDIEFEVRFHSDPTFTDLVQAGGTLLGAAEVGGATAGSVPEGAALATSAGRRGNDARAAFRESDSAIELTVNWTSGFCGVKGNLSGTVDGEETEGVCEGDGTTSCFEDAECDAVGGPCDRPPEPEPLVVNVDLSGRLVNQPPTASAGEFAGQSLECTSPAGAAFDLDGSRSHDPDDIPGFYSDIRLATWRLGDRLGDVLGTGLELPGQQLGVGELQTYYLRVIDSHAQAGQDTIQVAVVDTTAPDVVCNAPDTILPEQGLDRDHEAVAFTATAVDTCDPGALAEIIGFDCTAKLGGGRIVDKTDSCVVEFAGDTVTIVDSGGVGTRITWTVTATDASGNVSSPKVCGVDVVRR